MFKQVWEDQIALYSQDEPVFEVLPAAIDLQDRVSWSIDPTKLGLDHPVEYYLERDRAPLPIAADREGYYGDRNYEYWLSGLEMYSHTLEIMRKYGVPTRSYTEIGSASGRVIRHMAADAQFEDLWAFDINWRHICWMNRYLPKSIKAVHNSSIPTLPMESNSTDCVSAMSVFSHIETFELHWLAEIRRVLRPGGLALITVVTDHQIKAMDETWPMYNALTQHPRYSADFLDRLNAAGKLILRWHENRSYSSNVIYSTDYVNTVFGRFFEVVEIRNQFPIYQDCLILRKK